MLAYKEFRDYTNDRFLSSTSHDEYSGDSERLGRLLLKLPSLAEFQTNVIEEIFFVGLIGKHLIEKKKKKLFDFVSHSTRFSSNPKNHSVHR